MAKEATKSLESVLSTLRTKENLEIGAMDSFDDITPRGLSSGNITLDALTGIGGAPVGRITEFLGPPSSGKTTAALQIAAQLIKDGGHVMFLDYEHSLDPVYCDALGIDIADHDKFLYVRPEYFEQGANAFRTIQKETGGYIDLVIHDSIAAMTTQHELEADTGAVQVADRAKMLYQYCLTPDHKVLTEDLRWVPLGTCEVGDVILGFDENKVNRYYRRAVVKNVSRQLSNDMYRVTLSSGKTFRVTGNHKWLVGVHNGRGFGYQWRETTDLRIGIDHSPAFFDVWEEDQSKDAGWLAGMFDGEGHLNHRTNKRVSGMFIGIGQKMGPVADLIESLMKQFCGEVPTSHDSDIRRFGVPGPLRDKLKFLGVIRPERLIAKVDFDNMGRMQSWKRDPEAVVSVEKIEPEEVVVMETSTGTFIADGYPMHNCRQLNPALPRWDCAAIFLNHLLEKVDATPIGRQMAARGIKQWTSPGGNGIRYYASLRVEFKQIGNIKTDEMDLLNNETVKQIRQTKTQATVVKNKVADPFKSAELRVRFGRGFSNPYSVFSLLVAHNVIKKSGAWFTFPLDLALGNDEDNMKLQGEDRVLELIETNPDWEEVLTKKAKQILGLLGQDALETVKEDDIDPDLLLGQEEEPEGNND